MIHPPTEAEFIVMSIFCTILMLGSHAIKNETDRRFMFSIGLLMLLIFIFAGVVFIAEHLPE